MPATRYAIDPARVAERLAWVRERIAELGRDPRDVQVLAATKYVAAADMPLLAKAGVRLVGENRAQDLVAKQEVCGELFEWDFIGVLQSRKVRIVAPRVRLIHSVASESALAELAKHPAREVLLQVNVAREPGKAGIDPDALADFIARCPVPVGGLMTMPPLADDPEASRRWFRALRELAERHRLRHLSMGTSQDWEVAVQEGATIIRLGSTLLA
ncbi:YggS family pyridoxal phosphate enzyme [Thermoleophilum album]|uniref:Alanine racemase N-terminal domain-containing protein n=1 Tax=Thermoleophilum album TaxID=29539 RepID=A0A1H6FYI9_THEAL|nr:YggS family pyridoxal phosphate enzyme [Thermoleophilum album]SEH14785.1 hypothetical protein SAMN02745716_1736 [Thermoleophilum album]